MDDDDDEDDHDGVVQVVASAEFGQEFGLVASWLARAPQNLPERRRRRRRAGQVSVVANSVAITWPLSRSGASVSDSNFSQLKTATCCSGSLPATSNRQVSCWIPFHTTDHLHKGSRPILLPPERCQSRSSLF